MSSNPPRVLLPATAKDWRTLRQEAFARAPALTNGKWTDFNESDTGVGIVELLIGMVELLGYYQDRQANEVTFVNANDGTVEGFENADLKINCVQFHPEAHAGPMDTECHYFDGICRRLA